MPTVEAITRVYNETVDSILVTVASLNSQGHPIECILLVDDGSTDPPDFGAVAKASRIPVSVRHNKSLSQLES
jgi:glycosyltransferase involved in cell wall biosynthesis